MALRWLESVLIKLWTAFSLLVRVQEDNSLLTKQVSCQTFKQKALRKKHSTGKGMLGMRVLVFHIYVQVLAGA